LFDAEQARRAAEDWIEELAGRMSRLKPGIYWRRVTIAAAARLAAVPMDSSRETRRKGVSKNA